MPDLLELRPTGRADTVTYPPGASFGPRTGRDFEWVWLLEGESEYEMTLGGQTCTLELSEDTLLLCRPGALERFRWNALRPTRHAYVHFEAVSLPDSWPPPEVWPWTLPAQDGDLLRPLLRHLLTWQDGDMGQLRRVLELLLSSWVLGQTANAGPPAARVPEAVARALEHIYAQLERDPHANLALADLASKAGVSGAHLCRSFQRATGRSPLETVWLAKLDRAAGLLARSNYRVGEVAELCGFANAYHFSRRFKAAFGLSPRELRSRLEAGEAPPLPRLSR